MKSLAMPFSRRVLPARLVVERRDVAGADVLADQQLIADEVLEDDADRAAQRAGVPLAQVEAVEQDRALRSARRAA